MDDCYFEDVRAGQRFVTSGVTFTEAQMVEFALTYDPQAIHLDAHSTQAGQFGGLIASGMHTLAIACRLIQLTKPWTKSFLISPGIDQLRWLAPVRAGDTLHVETTIREARPSESRTDRGTLLLDHEVINQDGTLVMTFTVIELIARRAAALAAGS